jgi:hypothetical protein
MLLKNKKAQISLEYIIIVSIILIIGLVVAYLTNIFGTYNFNLGANFNKKFWEELSTPVTITEAYYNEQNLRFYFSLKSQEYYNITIKKIYLDDKQLAAFSYDSSKSEGVGNLLCSQASCVSGGCDCNIELQPRQEKQIVLEKFNLQIQNCSTNDFFQTSLKIVYRVQSSGYDFEYFPKFKLIVKCVK